LKFVADSNIILQIVPPNKTPQASILNIYLYSGTCSGLTLLASSDVNDSLMIMHGSFSVGSTYYVKVNRTATTSAYFGLGFQILTRASSTILSCPATTCNLIRNGGFETCNFTNISTLFLDSQYPFYPSWYMGTYNDTINDVCGWMRAWGTPQISPYSNTPPVNHFAMLWGQYSARENAKYGEGIMQTINIPAGSYTLNFSYNIPVGTSSMDSLIVCLTSKDFKEHDTINSGEAIPYSHWGRANRQIIFSAANVPMSTTWHHVSQPFTTTSNYSKIVIYPSQANTVATWLYLDSASVVPLQAPPVPIIAGQWDLCHTVGGVVTTSDTIKNWNSNYTYYYYIGANGTQHQFNSSPFTVNWTGHTNGGMLYVKVVGCAPTSYAVDSFKVFACCTNGPTIADTTITSATPITVTGTHYVNGQVILNANVTFGGTAHAYIWMGPNAKIIINPGYKLTVNDTSVIHAACDTMWDGIYLANSTSKLIVRGNSSIQDAKNAIVSINGGVFQLSNSDTLRNNYKGVVVKPYGGSHTGSISHTIIRWNKTLLPQYPPVTASRSYEGVEIDTVNSIYIGDTTAYANRNTFDSLTYGINATCSNIHVYNNKFLNMNRTMSAAWGINILGSGNYNPIVVIGKKNASGYFYSNYFNNCYNGIYYYSTTGGTINACYDTMVVQTLSHTAPVGIYAYTSSKSNINICNNSIVNGGWGSGINCANFGANSTVKISSNYVQNAITGIAATCANSTIPGSFQLAKNVISCPSAINNQTGIQVTNVQGNTNIRNSLLLDRVIFNSPNFSYTACGINVQYGTLDSIEQCSVTNTAAAPGDTTSAKNFTGIEVELSPNSYLCEDTAVNMGCGLRFMGSMPTSTIDVNYMNSNTYIGIRLDGANVGNQGTAALCNGNQWNANPKYRLQGTWTQVNWYYYGTGPGSMSLFPLGTYVYLVPTPGIYIASAPSYLSTCAVGSMQMILSNTVQDIVNNSYNYTANIAENKYTDNVTAYNILKNDPGILSSLSASDAKYQTFYNNIAAGNIGAFYKVNSMILAGDDSDAQVLNSAISPTNLMEINRQTVNNIFVNSWAAGRFDLTTAEHNTLYGIAMQQPILGGSGVYSARVMVGEPLANLEKTRTTGENDNNIPKLNVAGLIYPNPVTNSANLDYSIKAIKAELVIYDITGKEIKKFNLNVNDTHFSFNTESYKSGLYFYKINTDTETIANNKFIIIK
jgi:hypothetical protein